MQEIGYGRIRRDAAFSLFPRALGCLSRRRGTGPFDVRLIPRGVGDRGQGLRLGPLVRGQRLDAHEQRCDGVALLEVVRLDARPVDALGVVHGYEGIDLLVDLEPVAGLGAEDARQGGGLSVGRLAAGLVRGFDIQIAGAGPLQGGMAGERGVVGLCCRIECSQVISQRAGDRLGEIAACRRDFVGRGGRGSKRGA